MAHADRLTSPLAPRLAALAPGALLLFLAAAFALPKEPAYALVFYLLCVPPLLATVLTARPAACAAPSAAAWLAAGVVAWSGCTLLWGVDDGERSLKFLRDTLCTLLFVPCVARAAMDPLWRARARLILVVGGTGTACLALIRGLAGYDEARLHGWGATLHPILGGQVMVAAGLTAVWLGLTAQSWRARATWLGCAVPMAAFIGMTGSRGPMLAGWLALLLLCAAGSWRRPALGTVAALSVLWFAMPASMQARGAAAVMARGSSHRLEIWDEAARMIGDRPFLGHGLAANMHMAVPDQGHMLPITFPHDMYLSLLFYSGVVGLGLFLTLIAALALGLARPAPAARPARGEVAWLTALLAAALIGGLTDVGQITKGPGPLWLMLWLPVGMAAALCPPVRLAAWPALARRAVPAARY